ncbi:hypothetical protein NQZ68_001627 [Dissostichus eleginoides]|nr:hypothetical protein NQZ68_001627 [Dissostichus eleginoides]
MWEEEYWEQQKRTKGYLHVGQQVGQHVGQHVGQQVGQQNNIRKHFSSVRVGTKGFIKMVVPPKILEQIVIPASCSLCARQSERRGESTSESRGNIRTAYHLAERSMHSRQATQEGCGISCKTVRI